MDIDDTDPLSSEPVTSSEYDPQVINAELYKRNMELAVVNKTLTLLRKLYQISLLVLDPDVLAEKISETVRTDMNMEMVGIFLFSSTTNSLIPFTFSTSERLSDVLSLHKINFKQFAVEDVSDKHFLSDIITKKVSAVAHRFEEIWAGTIEAPILYDISAQSHIRNILLYPLTTQEKSIGILVLGFNRAYDTLSDHEQNAISGITDVIALALEKATLYKDLQTANEGQSNLIHIINHQIKGYLTKGRLVLSELTTNPEYAPGLSDSGKRLAQQGFDFLTEGNEFIQGVLHASSIDQGVMQYDKQPFDFRELFDEVLVKATKAAQVKGIKLIHTVDDGQFEYVGDRRLLKEVLNNLLDNAIRYTPEGSVTATLSHQQNSILIQVIDTGIGITEEDKKRLFTRGGRGKNSSRINVDSTGYGLYFAKNVIDAHNGSITAVSAGENKGTMFTVFLPVTKG